MFTEERARETALRTDGQSSLSATTVETAPQQSGQGDAGSGSDALVRTSPSPQKSSGGQG